MSTSSLERVRRIKNRLVRLTTRVQTLREMLEKLMDDDSDMHAMNLTARAQDQLERQVGLLRPRLYLPHFLYNRFFNPSSTLNPESAIHCIPLFTVFLL